MCCTSVGNKELHWLRRSKAVNAVSTHGLVHLLIKNHLVLVCLIHITKLFWFWTFGNTF